MVRQPMNRLRSCLIGIAVCLAGARGVSAGAPESVRVALGFGYVSPLADPHVAEGYGGGAEFWVRVFDRLGARVSIDVTQNDLEGDLDAIPWPYATGDVTFGPLLEITPPGSPVEWSAGVETGPYWSAYVLGLKWTWGVNFATALVWRFTRYLGVQIQAKYHLYNLDSLDGDPFLCPRTMRPAPTLDRFDLLASVAVTM